MAFAKLKALLRRARHRRQGALWDGIGQILSQFPPDECARYLAHRGYGHSK